MIVNLISSPRNVSTALMYSFAHRGDMQVFDEPFYAYYLNLTGADHPGKEEIIASQSSIPEKVVSTIQQLDSNVFIKNMAHHLIEMELSFLKNWKNVFLIRNPAQLISSFAEVIANPTQSDIGIEQQFELYNFLKKEGKDITVIDSGELLENPRNILAQLCEKLDLPMKEGMVSWKAGALAEDGVWAKYWYYNVHQSTGFSPQKTSSRSLPSHCQKLYDESLPYYEELSKLAIKAI